MQVVERVLYIPDWITLLLFFTLVLLVILKALNSHKFAGVVSSIFNKGFVELESQEPVSPFNFFNVVFTLFSLLSISLGVFLTISHVVNQTLLFFSFSKVLLLVMVYMFSRFVLEFLLTHLFSIKEEMNFFFQSKRIYLFSISVGIWCLVLFYSYAGQNLSLFLIGCGALFLIRLLVILTSNKNLIFNKLFYFILYLCAFEIAPLLILYKMITQ